LSHDPYKRGAFKSNPYYAKNEITGNLVVVLQGYFPDRNLELIKPISRALLSGEIHEIILTDENAGPGDTVNNITYLGFVEIAGAGVAVAGDIVSVDGREIGRLAGFDITHMPNHLNIVIKTDLLKSGADQGFCLGQTLEFRAGGGE